MQKHPFITAHFCSSLHVKTCPGELDIVVNGAVGHTNMPRMAENPEEEENKTLRS